MLCVWKAGYLGTVEGCSGQHVLTGRMQYEMQKEILYLGPQTSRRYSGQYPKGKARINVKVLMMQKFNC